MAQKRPNLANIGNAGGSVLALRSQESETPPVQAETPNDAPSRKAAATRAGTSQIAGHYPKAVRQQLKMLSAERGRFMEDMIAEALNDLFAKYGKAEIAPVRGKNEGA